MKQTTPVSMVRNYSEYGKKMFTVGADISGTIKGILRILSIQNKVLHCDSQSGTHFHIELHLL